MFFFKGRKRQVKIAQQEEQIQRIHQETINKIDSVSKHTRKLNDLIENDGDIASLIYHATGADRRKK